MGSTGQTLMRFLPGVIETAGGAATGNPMLATMGAGQLAGAASGTAPAQSSQPGLGGWGNLVGQVGAPLLGTAGSMMANRPQPMAPTPPPAQPMRAPQPMTPNAPIGPAQTSSPMSSLMKYQQFLRGMG